jgi:hypothetical protein
MYYRGKEVMKKLGVVFAVIFTMCLVLSCGNLPTNGKFINALNGTEKVTVKTLSDDYFVGDWYPIKYPGLQQIHDFINISYDGENYIQRTNRFEISNGESHQIVNEVIYQKKNDFLLIPVAPMLSGLGLMIRYDKNSRHIVISSTFVEPVEYHKNGDY